MFTKYIENFLSEDECKELIQLGESFELQHMKSTKIVDGKVVSQNMEYDGNKRSGCYFVDDTLSLPLLQSVSNKLISLSNSINPFKSIEYTNISKYSFNKYTSGDFLDWHEDRHEIFFGATITYILQLNDNYGGGYVRYITDDGIEYRVPKKEGSVFVFDSNILHSVDVVDSGYRYSINVWPRCIKNISLI